LKKKQTKNRLPGWCFCGGFGVCTGLELCFFEKAEIKSMVLRCPGDKGFGGWLDNLRQGWSPKKQDSENNL
jgi:ssDNA-binding Zn-finger/Zn-ribbon topoisomerase 1